LRNECDEEFRFIQAHVRETIAALLKAIIREKFHHKSEKEVNKMTEQIRVGAIEQWIGRRIIEKMYDHDDCEYLEDKFAR
jgi:hypothetical protein